MFERYNGRLVKSEWDKLDEQEKFQEYCKITDFIWEVKQMLNKY
jgi:hypothetical protein